MGNQQELSRQIGAMEIWLASCIQDADVEAFDKEVQEGFGIIKQKLGDDDLELVSEKGRKLSLAMARLSRSVVLGFDEEIVMRAVREQIKSARDAERMDRRIDRGP